MFLFLCSFLRPTVQKLKNLPRTGLTIEMKNVLIISYYWPPAGGPGSQRAVKFAKYLPQFGWQPIILTVLSGEFPYIDSTLTNDLSPKTKVFRTTAIEPYALYKILTSRNKEEKLPVSLLTQDKKGITERLSFWIRTNFFIPDARIGWIPSAVKKALDIIKKENISLVFTTSPPHSLQIIGWLIGCVMGAGRQFPR